MDYLKEGKDPHYCGACSWCLNTQHWKHVVSDNYGEGQRHLFVCRGEYEGYECGRTEEIYESIEKEIDND